MNDKEFSVQKIKIILMSIGIAWVIVVSLRILQLLEIIAGV